MWVYLGDTREECRKKRRDLFMSNYVSTIYPCLPRPLVQAEALPNTDTGGPMLMTTMIRSRFAGSLVYIVHSVQYLNCTMVMEVSTVSEQFREALLSSQRDLCEGLQILHAHASCHFNRILHHELRLEWNRAFSQEHLPLLPQAAGVHSGRSSSGSRQSRSWAHHPCQGNSLCSAGVYRWYHMS